MLIYNSTASELQGYDGTTWQNLAGGGTAETLAQTLAAGNTTGANDIQVSTGQKISGVTTLALDSIGDGNNVTIDASAATTTDKEGGHVQINAGTGNGTGAGGASSLYGGTGGNDGSGGVARLFGGDAGGGNNSGGDARVHGGDGSGTSAGGEVELDAGIGGAAVASTSAAGLGGPVDINAGAGGAGATAHDGGIGGVVTIDAGAGGVGASGQTGGTGGTVTITGGPGGAANGGTEGDGGDVTIVGGSSTAGLDGRVLFTSGGTSYPLTASGGAGPALTTTAQTIIEAINEVAGGGAAFAPLVSKTNIELGSIGTVDQLVYTVSSSKNLIVTDVWVEITAASGASAPICRMGVGTGSADDIYRDNTMTGLTSVGDTWRFIPGGLAVIATDPAVIYITPSTLSSGTLTATVHLFGYEFS
jgi:hypothetical protein